MPGADFHVCHGDALGVTAEEPPVAVAPSMKDCSHATSSSGGGGGRGAYSCADGGFPVALRSAGQRTGHS